MAKQKIELPVQKITILGNSPPRGPFPKILITCLPGREIEDMKKNVEQLSIVMVDHLKLKNLTFHVEWDE